MRFSPRLSGCCTFWAALLLLAGAVRAQCHPWWLPGFSVAGTNDNVYALAVAADGSLIAGGRFTIAGGVFAGGVARWNGSSWSSLGTGMNDEVDALVTLPNGDVVAGGSFSNAGGVPMNNVARWNGSAWSALGSGLGPVYAVVAQADGSVVAGGSFGVARWDGATWVSMGNPGTVEALVVEDNGDIVAGGNYAYAYDWTVGFVSRWHASGWTRVGGDFIGSYPNPPYQIGFGTVSALLTLPDFGLVAGGDFGDVGGAPRGNVARWDGAAWVSMAGGMDGPVYALSRLGGAIVATGSFGTAAGAPANCAARWNGATWIAMGAGPEDSVYAAAVMPDGALVTGGVFDDGGSSGFAACALSRWDGGAWSPLSTGINGLVDGLAASPQGDLIVTGQFTMIGGVRAGKVARWDGSAWSPLGPGFLNAPDNFVGPVAALPNGDIVVGGQFTSAGGVEANNVARWDGQAWWPLGAGLTGGVYRTFVSALFVMPNGDLIAGGNFALAGGVPAADIARWDGATWSPLGGGISADPYVGSVSALAALHDGSLVAGGFFSVAGGVPVNRIARWDGAAWRPLGSGMTPYQSGAYTSVWALAVLPSGDLVAGGAFDLAGGVWSHGIARWDGSAWHSMDTDSGWVHALIILPNGDLVAAAENLLLRWRDSLWSPLAPAMGGEVHALAVLPRGDLFAGGEFGSAGDQVSVYLARWACACYANCDNSTTPPVLNVSDFVCFLDRFAAGDAYANCDGSTAPPVMNVNDFLCFLNRFGAGCP